MESFLQTKDWANFQETFGKKVFWIDDKLVVKFDLPLGKSWLYAPRVEFKTQSSKFKTQEEELFYKELTKLAKKENAIFVKIESNRYQEVGIRNQALNPNSSYLIHNTACLQPQDELVLDISLSEDKLLEQMHPKTRYNIRLAQKKDLKVVFSQDSKDVDDFYNLAIKTSIHDGFKYHSKSYYKKMLEVLGDSKNVQVELVTIFSENKIENDCHSDDCHPEVNPKDPNEILRSTQNDTDKIHNSNHSIASAILLYHNDICYYLHGASDWSKRQLMAPYLMQWESIKRAKKKGCKLYNFGGVSPLKNTELENKLITEQNGINQVLSDLNKSEIINLKSKISTNHSWGGITRFKTGFINQNFLQENFLHYPDAYDIIYQRGMYWIYKLIKKLK
jgi:lipid II:glycine glycyltransferase (peptidoglycan interpeptide bridge formation enzyme)